MRILEGFEGHDIYVPGETKSERTAPHPINRVGGRALDGYMNPGELDRINAAFPAPELVQGEPVMGEGVHYSYFTPQPEAAVKRNIYLGDSPAAAA